MKNDDEHAVLKTISIARESPKPHEEAKLKIGRAFLVPKPVEEPKEELKIQVKLKPKQKGDLNMGNNDTSYLMAGKDFSWEMISGDYLRVQHFTPLAQVNGDQVIPARMIAFGILIVELANPDIKPEQRFLYLPIEHKSDYKSVFRAHIDTGVRNKTNELVVLYEYRRGFLGWKKACLHVAAFPSGTWGNFFDAVTRYAAKDFRWPKALFLFQPTSTQVFTGNTNLFTN